MGNKKVKTIGVYARIVGYYRPIDCWNNGKKQEWKDRAFTSMAGVK